MGLFLDDKYYSALDSKGNITYIYCLKYLSSKNNPTEYSTRTVYFHNA